MSRMTLFLLVVGGLLVASLGGLYLSQLVDRPGSTVSTSNSGRALVGGPFQLTAHDGTTVTEKSFPEEFKLIFFGFTFCPDVCPTELQVMSSALDLLGEEAAQVRPILITVDPERDTVETMAAYVQHFHPKLVGLTGTVDQISETARTFRVYYQKVEDPGSASEYTMDHSSIVYLMDREGVFVTHFGAATPPDQMAEKIRDALAAAR